MENASKALIIAGAILLSILIISLGIMIYNQAKEAVGNTGMDQNRISTYNAEFESYLGTKVNGAKVKSLIGVVKAHNLAIANTDETLLVGITGLGQNPSTTVKINNTQIGNTTANDLEALKGKVKTGSMYKVTADYDTTTGYLINIKLEAITN